MHLLNFLRSFAYSNVPDSIFYLLIGEMELADIHDNVAEESLYFLEIFFEGEDFAFGSILFGFFFVLLLFAYKLFDICKIILDKAAEFLYVFFGLDSNLFVLLDFFCAEKTDIWDTFAIGF